MKVTRLTTNEQSIGVAVIGAGMAGRAHAAAFRSAGTVFRSGRPAIRLVAISDVNLPLADSVRRRYGFARAEGDWEAIAQASDIDAVSVAVDNRLHRPIVEGLLAAGKHVLCEKPLAPTIQDALSMEEAARAAGRVAAVAYVYRRSPALCAIAREIGSGRLGTVLHFSGHAWFDYGLDPAAPLTWRYRGPAGSGVLADVGSHLIDTAELLCGPIVEVRGGLVTTAVAERPMPAGPTVGHAKVPVTQATAPVENEDIATFTALFGSGALGSFSISRVACAQPDGLGFSVFCTGGAASFDLHRLSEFTISDLSAAEGTRGTRTVFVGPHHPYVTDGLPIDSAGVGHGTADLFVFQARAFLDEITGITELPRCASFAEAISGMAVTDAVVRSAAGDGSAIRLAAAGSPTPFGLRNDGRPGR
jgi:predicted dehydrogenase